MWGRYGMKVMVSSWPFSAVNSTSFEDIKNQGLGVTVKGSSELSYWDDNNCADTGGVKNRKCFLYDPTQEAARSYYWSRLSKGYYSHGIKIFWLDASEPEISTPDALHAASILFLFLLFLLFLFVGSAANQSLIITSYGLGLGFQKGANNLELRCALRPSTEGAGCKTRPDSRFQKCDPHFISIFFFQANNYNNSLGSGQEVGMMYT